eukprot:6201571-Pleurochrysis_carterae.AAC.2
MSQLEPWRTRPRCAHTVPVSLHKARTRACARGTTPRLLPQRPLPSPPLATLPSSSLTPLRVSSNPSQRLT